ncbi:hypothetical protein BC826DRAFT_1022126 [Russula brevipes]|nr:hypothetical protein BC826DRAFT_1022126 [Russula brevipes]
MSKLACTYITTQVVRAIRMGYDLVFPTNLFSPHFKVQSDNFDTFHTLFLSITHMTSKLFPDAGCREEKKGGKAGADPSPIATLSWRGGDGALKPERGIKWKTQCSAYLHATTAGCCQHTADQARKDGFWCHLDWAHSHPQRRHTSTSEDPCAASLSPSRPCDIRQMNCFYSLWKAASRG